MGRSQIRDSQACCPSCSKPATSATSASCSPARCRCCAWPTAHLSPAGVSLFRAWRAQSAPSLGLPATHKSRTTEHHHHHPARRAVGCPNACVVALSTAEGIPSRVPCCYLLIMIVQTQEFNASESETRTGDHCVLFENINSKRNGTPTTTTLLLTK